MQETLEQLLARLKAEIEDAEHGDVDREELARLAKAVETKLAERADATGDVETTAADTDDDDLAEDLREGVVRWESSHPELANFLHRAADTLSGIGL
jgi:DNA-binding transcriptional regulator YdaS (Cro superfamily)